MDIPQSECENSKRLIVFVPDGLANQTKLAYKIHWIAIREKRDVLYLTLVDDPGQVLPISRSMATMKAITSGNWLTVNSKLVETRQWFAVLKELYRPGDLIVCHEEQTVNMSFLKAIPVNTFLQQTLNEPVLTVTGFYHPQHLQWKLWLRDVLDLIGILLIIGMFTGLEVQIEGAARGAAQIILEMLAVSIEVGSILIWKWIGPR